MDTELDRAASSGAPLALLRLVDDALGQAHTPGGVAGALLPELAGRLGAAIAVLWVVDGQGSPPRPAGRFPSGAPDAYDAGIAERVLRDGTPAWIEDKEAGFSALALRLGEAADPDGVLEFRGAGLDRPDPHLLESLELAADLIGRHLRLLRSEEAAAALRAAFRLPNDELPAITYIDALDGVSQTLYISPQTESMLGYTEQQWLDDPDLWEKLIHPEDRDWVLAENARTMAEGDPFRAEYRMITKDGTVRWFRDEAWLVREDGRAVFWRGFLVDVTDRRSAESTLATAEARYRALVENIPAITYVETPEDRTILYVSPQLEALTGYTPEERMSDPDLWRKTVHSEDWQRFLEADRQADATGGPFALDYRIVAKDGRTVWLHDRAVLLRDTDGLPLFWQRIAFDVTERVAAEDERRHLLAHLVSAQEEERSRIAIEVHDDPIQKMTVADLRLQMLRPHLSEEGKALLDGLQASVRDSISSMRHLLMELRPPTLDEGLAAALRDYVSDTVRDVWVDIRDADLTEEPSAAVRTVAYRIAQEALTNARKHAQARRIEVELGSRDGGVQVRIGDDGVGFPVLDTKPVAGHIGLQAMRERATMAGGRLTVQSEPGAGTTVEFWLPDAATP